MLIGFLITLWATLFVESWKRVQRTIQYLWNCKDISFSRQDERDETFKFYEVFNHRTGSVEKEKKLITFTTNIIYRVVSLACLVAIVYIMIGYREMLGESKEEGQKYYGWGIFITAGYSCLVVVIGILYKWLTNSHTEAENHRYQRHHDDALISRLFLVNFLNFYLPALTIAFDSGNSDSYMDIF